MPKKIGGLKPLRKMKEATGINLAYSMGHILYMAKLAGIIQKKSLIDSVPKQEKERYLMALEALLQDGILIKVIRPDKKTGFSINPEHGDEAKGLIARFVKGIKEDKKGQAFSKNPFFHRGPIKDIDHFIGRGDTISHIFDRLRHTEDCSIIGPRAIGKTSLLHYLSHPDVVKKYHLDPKKYIFMYTDLARYGDSAGPADFLFEMFSRTETEITQNGFFTPEDISRINEESGTIIKKANKSLFEISDLETLIGVLSGRDYRLVYMFDEFEYVANNTKFDVSFYGQLRAISGNPDYKVALITSSKKSIYDLTFDEEIKTSPFFRYFEDFNLGPMSYEEMEGFFELSAKSGVVFSPLVKKLIVTWSGRHPFIAQLACDYFFDMKVAGKKMDSESEEKHLVAFLKQHRKHFSYFWKQMNDKQQKCFWKLASGKSLPADCKGIINDLEEDYLVSTKNGGYEIFSTAFARFVSDMPSPKPEKKSEQNI
jgi:hypothetical protein